MGLYVPRPIIAFKANTDTIPDIEKMTGYKYRYMKFEHYVATYIFHTSDNPGYSVFKVPENSYVARIGREVKVFPEQDFNLLYEPVNK